MTIVGRPLGSGLSALGFRLSGSRNMLPSSLGRPDEGVPAYVVLCSSLRSSD